AVVLLQCGVEPGLRHRFEFQVQALAAEQLDAKAAIARAVDAMGGQAAFDAVDTYYSKATITVGGQDLSSVVEVWWRNGDFYMRSEMPGLGVAQVWKHGEETWGDDPVRGRHRLEGKQARAAMLDACPSLLAYWRRYFEHAQAGPAVAVEGRALVYVQFTGPDAADVTVGLDTDSGLPATHTSVRDTPQGALPVTTWLHDYREVAEIRVPFRSTISMSLYEAVVDVQRFDIGVDIDPGTFDPKP
ncbi:MAG: hypothetical protein JKY37_22380, partial [Nannocystaceae bacterium]|nr:hypothetical protein [Nannocystaceae bacterium]